MVMTRLARSLVLAVLALAGAAACAKVPYTGRKQFNLVPDGVLQAIGSQSYRSTLSEAHVVRGSEGSRTLDQVGRRISRAAAEPDFDWEYALLRDDTVNAWCLPGGKIAFYTGILPVLRNEAGMAFVMGHEVGHATAKHGGERLTQQLSVLGGLTALDLFLSTRSDLTERQRGTIMSAIGLGAEVGILLPFSRAHEAEADIIGMMYMARAGYPPAESIEVWQRMERLTGGSAVPAFLSTHPSHASRQENLREWLPKARKRYDRNKLPGDPLDPLWGRGADEGDRDRPAADDGVTGGKGGKKGGKKGGGGGGGGMERPDAR